MTLELPPKAREEVVTSLGKGDVLFWGKYKFPDPKDKEFKDSYIFIISEIIQNDSFLVIRGTADSRGIYETSLGKRKEIFRLNPKDCQFLKKETILNFEHIVEISKEKIVKDFSVGAKRIGKIPQEIMKQLNQAILSAKTVERWKQKIIKESQASSL